MNNIYIYFFVCISLISCTDDKDLSNIILNQSFWTGELILNGQVKESYDIDLVFETENTGGYSINNCNPDFIFSSKTTFFYKIESKSILIEGGFNNVLAGYWWVINDDGKKMLLKRNINNKEGCDMLSLIKLI